MFHLRKLIFCASITASLWGCGDDTDNGDNDTDGTSGSSGSSSTAGSGNKAGSGGKAGSPSTGGTSSAAGETSSAGEATGGSDVSGGSGGSSGSSGSGGSDTNPGGAGEPGQAGEGGAGGEGNPVSPFPKFPAAIALSGCSGVGPICTATQDEGQLALKCGTRAFTGTITENGDYTLTGAAVTSGTTTTNTTCTGNVRPSGVVGTCENTVSPPPSSGSATTTCALAVNAKPLPGISCIELPSEFSNFQFDTTDLGECKLVQNNCNFQANCAQGVVVGTATATGANFSYTLTAKAAAAAPEGGTPAFLQGAQISHPCVTTLAGDALQGSCSAGAYSARGATSLPATSVYDFEAVASKPVPVCSAIGPFTEDLFVLDSCAILKEGEGNEPGLGEPICAFQQNGCIWKVSCMTDPAAPVVFSGKLTPGQTQATWNLNTGTPCEASFDANGNMAGKCTVPGAPACLLKSKAPSPAVGCPQLSSNFTSRGCGNDSDGIPLECRLSLQNGCDFAAICDFSVSRFPDSIFSGKSSTVAGVDYLKFPGLGGRSCSVQRATEAEYSNPANCRVEGEWYGDCLTASGNGCANSFQCVADANGNYPSPFSNIRRGLRLFFD
jgi:hypothetical protein